MKDDATIVRRDETRRDEFDLEEKCITSVEAIPSDIGPALARSSVDQVRAALPPVARASSDPSLIGVGLGARASEGS